MASRSQPGAQLFMIFNNAIMDDRHSIRNLMGMSICLCHAAMGCPSCMTNTNGTCQRRFGKMISQRL